MYTDHFDLYKTPFANVHDPHFLILSQDQQKALGTMLHAVKQREGWALLMGRSGEGKTTLIMALLMQLTHEVISAVITDPKLDPLDFFNLLSLELGMEGPYAGKEEFLSAFRQYLVECRKERKSVLVIMDEAQSINLDLLEELKLLSNQDDGPTKVLNIILVAQPQFRTQLKQSKSKGLIQRLRRFHNLRPLNEAETSAYIRHRLSAAGAEKNIFESAALAEVYRASQGNCRLINTICDQAMQLAFERNQARVTPEMVGLVAESAPLLSILGQADQMMPGSSAGDAETGLQESQPDQAERAEAEYAPVTPILDASALEKSETAAPPTGSGPEAEPKRAEKPRRIPTMSIEDLEYKPQPQAEARPEKAAMRPKEQPETLELRSLDLEADDYFEDAGEEPKRGMIRRAAGVVFSLKGMAVAAVLLILAGTAFFSLGGLKYAKRAWWRYRQQAAIVVPDEVIPNKSPKAAKPEQPKRKRPPDWGPTLYIPSNNARAQGGGHG